MNGILHPEIDNDEVEEYDDDDEVPTLLNLDEDDCYKTETPQSSSSSRAADVDDVDDRRVLRRRDGGGPPPPSPFRPRPPGGVVPVTILTGFLGSGKSTLVRHILTSPDHGRRMAVVENEFGGGGETLADRMGLSVESVIVRDGTSSSSSPDGDGGRRNLLADLIELPNGCVCCTVKDTLVVTLERLLEARTDIDYVLIECSGMADPGPVASIFWLDGALDSRLRLDGVVCCVDARNIGYQLECTSSSSSSHRPSSFRAASSSAGCGPTDGGEGAGGGGGEGGDEAARQIAFADRIIVNKVDLLGGRRGPTPDQGGVGECDANDGGYGMEGSRSSEAAAMAAVESVMRRIEKINPTAPVRATTYSRVDDLGWILDADCFDADRARDVEAAFQRLSSTTIDDDDDDDNDNDEPSGRPCTNVYCAGNHRRRRTPPRDSDPHVCGLCTDADGSSSSSRRSGGDRGGRRHRHTDAVGTIALSGAGSVDLRLVNSWLASILWPDQDAPDGILRARLEGREGMPPTAPMPSDGVGGPRSNGGGGQTIYRVKGVLSVIHAVDGATGSVVPGSNDHVDDGIAAGLVDPDDGRDGRRFIVQAVNDLWDVLPASADLCWDDDAAGGGTRCCRVIVIGKWLDEARLRAGFGECFVP